MADTKRTCSIDGCDSPHKSRGYCNRHYRRALRYGDPNHSIRYTSDEALIHRVERDGDCLVWTGGKNQKGYGRLRVNGIKVSVHRYAWEKMHGTIPAGLEIDHTCWNRACVNTDHMRLATRSENKRNAQGARRDSALGIRGVREEDGKYRGRVTKDGTWHTALFDTLEEAREWVEAKRQELFGEFAGK